MGLRAFAKIFKPGQLQYHQVTFSEVFRNCIKHRVCQAACSTQLKMPERVIALPFLANHLCKVLTIDVAENAVAQHKFAAFKAVEDYFKHVLSCEFREVVCIKKTSTCDHVLI